MLFLDASDEAILRRFSETRRPHPPRARCAEGTRASRAVAVLDGSSSSASAWRALRQRATVSSTPRRSPSTSCAARSSRTSAAAGRAAAHGARGSSRSASSTACPVDADLVFDVRFLDNPYFVPEPAQPAGHRPRRARLRARHPDGAVEPPSAHVEAPAAFVASALRARGKSYLTVAIGCTGGRHRSVTVAAEPRRRPSRKDRRSRSWSCTATSRERDHLRTATAPPAAVAGARGGRRVSDDGLRHVHDRQQTRACTRARRPSWSSSRRASRARSRLLGPGRPGGQRQERDGRAPALRLEGHVARGRGRRRRGATRPSTPSASSIDRPLRESPSEPRACSTQLRRHRGARRGVAIAGKAVVLRLAATRSSACTAAASRADRGQPTRSSASSEPSRARSKTSRRDGQRASATAAPRASILEAYVLMVGDETLRRGRCARRSTSDAAAPSGRSPRHRGPRAASSRAVDDPYLRERSHDVEFVGERLLRALGGRDASTACPASSGPSIIVAHDLSPADTAGMVASPSSASSPRWARAPATRRSWRARSRSPPSSASATRSAGSARRQGDRRRPARPRARSIPTTTQIDEARAPRRRATSRIAAQLSRARDAAATTR